MFVGCIFRITECTAHSGFAVSLWFQMSYQNATAAALHIHTSAVRGPLSLSNNRNNNAAYLNLLLIFLEAYRLNVEDSRMSGPRSFLSRYGIDKLN